MRLARLLLAAVLFLTLTGPLSQTARADARGGLRRVGSMLRQEAREWGATLRCPRRVARIAASGTAGVAVGLTALHLTGSSGTAAFSSYVTSTIADRAIDRAWPSTRPVGADAPPSLGVHGAQMLVGASVAALVAPMLLDALHPVAMHVASIGDGAPGLIGVGAQAVFGTSLVRGMGNMGASLIATGVQNSLARLMKLRPKWRRSDAERVLR